jgi:hypothetical protein
MRCNMAQKKWEICKTCYCKHVKGRVALEVEVLYPIDFLPDPPRLLAHRCSHGVQCNQFAEASCIWAGTNPTFDPFRT